MVEPLPASAPTGCPPPLVGRDREQALLRGHLAAALAGQGRLVLIGGEAGIGKTALAEALLAEARGRGAQILVGRCYDLSETPPYGPWAEALARMPLTPDLAVPPALGSDPSGAGTPVSQAALFGRVRDFIAATAARQPLVLLLDDLHWADHASLDLLRFLARELASLPILVVAIYRTEELTRHHPLFPLLPLLVREAATTRLDLRVLGDDAIRALLRARYPLADPHEARLVTYLQARAEGNPFFTGELLRALEEVRLLCAADGGAWALGDLASAGIPPLLQHVLEGRVGRLGESARDLLAVAAVIGQDVPLALWAAVGDVAEEALLAVVERAVGAHLLLAAADGTSVRFVHALVRETLYEGLLPPRRRGWHRRVGEALLTLPHPDPDAVAHHFGRAGDPRASDWLIRAGLRAWRAAAWLSAAERFAAAALPDQNGSRARARGWLHHCRALLLILSDNAQALRALDEAEPLALAVGDRALAAFVRFTRGMLWCLGGAIRRGLAELEREVIALEALPAAYHRRSGQEVALATLAALLAGDAPAAPESPPVTAGTAVTPYRANVVHWLAMTGRYREALTMGEAFLAALADVGTAAPLRVGAPAYHGLGHAHAALGHPAEARRAYARSRAGYTEANNARMVWFTLWNELLLALLPYQADDVAERTQLAAEAAGAWGRARGTIIATPDDDPAALLPALIEGRWAEAGRLARDGLAAAASGPSQGALAALGLLARHQGDPDDAWARVRALHPAGPDTAPGDCHFPHGLALQSLAADLALDANDPPTASAWVEAHGRWLAWSGAVLWQADHQRLRARLALASGDLSAARAHTEAALARATEPRQPLALLAAHRLLGELDSATDRHADAAAHLNVALALADACAAPYERALTLLALAELRAASGPGGDAVALLAEVRAICTPLEARPALARAAALAGRLAAPPPLPPFGLTAREAEVLRQLAEGATDAAIAASLSISVNTVNKHVASILAKTGTANRTAAAAALRRALP